MPETVDELRVSNHLLGDAVALAAAWERDGYWFFRDVLDRTALWRLRAVYEEALLDRWTSSIGPRAAKRRCGGMARAAISSMAW